MSKSFVTMEQKVCQVCGHTYDTGSLLLDKRLKERFEMHTTTGLGLCEKDQKLYDDNYIALIEVDNEPTNGTTFKSIGEANRTGRIAHVKKDALKLLDGMEHPFVYVEKGVLEELQKGMKQ